MPYRQKGSPYWYIRVTGPSGKPAKRSSGTTSFEEAKALESKDRLETFQQKRWGAAPKYTYDQVMARYLGDTAEKKSHSRDLTSALNLTPHFTGKVIDDLTGEDIAAYKKLRRDQRTKHGKVISWATIVKELYLLSAAITYVQAELDWKVNNPTKGRVPQIKTKAPRWLSKEEVAAFIKAALEIAARRHRTSPMVVEFAKLTIATGMRTGEALGLEWSRVDFGARLIYFDIDDQKSEVPGSIPLNDTAITVLRERKAYCKEHCQDTQWVFCHSDGTRVVSLKKAVHTAAAEAKLKRVTPHTFRHTFGAQMTQLGVDIRELKDLMRHSDIRTTMIYSHLRRDSGQRLINRMDAVFAPEEVRHDLGEQQEIAA